MYHTQYRQVIITANSKQAANNELRKIFAPVEPAPTVAQVESLLEQGGDVDCQLHEGSQNGWFKNSSLLHMAILHNWTEIAELLIKRGANPNVPNEDGDTPLHIAASMARVFILQSLVEQAKTTDILHRHKNNLGETPHDCAQTGSTLGSWTVEQRLRDALKYNTEPHWKRAEEEENWVRKSYRMKPNQRR